MIAAKITQEEKDSTKATVDEDRKHAIEAAIVRIMKTRKTLDHQKLVLEASNQLLRCARAQNRDERTKAAAPPSQPQLDVFLVDASFLSFSHTHHRSLLFVCADTSSPTLSRSRSGLRTSSRASTWSATATTTTCTNTSRKFYEKKRVCERTDGRRLFCGADDMMRDERIERESGGPALRSRERGGVMECADGDLERNLWRRFFFLSVCACVCVV